MHLVVFQLTCYLLYVQHLRVLLWTLFYSLRAGDDSEEWKNHDGTI